MRTPPYLVQFRDSEGYVFSEHEIPASDSGYLVLSLSDPLAYTAIQTYARALYQSGDEGTATTLEKWLASAYEINLTPLSGTEAVETIESPKTIATMTEWERGIHYGV